MSLICSQGVWWFFSNLCDLGCLSGRMVFRFSGMGPHGMRSQPACVPSSLAVTMLLSPPSSLTQSGPLCRWVEKNFPDTTAAHY